MLTCGQVYDLDIAIGKSRMMDAVKVSLPIFEVCFPGDGIDFHKSSLWRKSGKSQSE
jgi:hypothetical protein